MRVTVFDVAVAIGILLVTAGCWTEGNSHFIGRGETKRFLTMSRCVQEATSRYPDGNPRYSGYECRGKSLFFTTEKRDYASGRLESLTK